MSKFLKDKVFIKWLVIGVLIRIILMPITLHPDLWGHSFVSYFFAYKGVINIYDYLLALPSSHPLVANFGVSDIFIYPPLTYFTLGFFRVLIKPFVDPNFIPWVMSNLSIVHTRPDLPANLFLFKLPYLFIDIGVGVLLKKLFTESRRKNMIFALWMLNPVTLYATFMMGQFDVLPVFFTVLALVLSKNKKFMYSMIALGIGASYKMYPIFFVIPAALLYSNKLTERIKYIVVGIVPFVLFMLPFLGSSAFRQMVLFGEKSQKMLFMQFPVSGAEGLYPFVLGLILIYFIAYYKTTKLKLVDYFLAIMLLIFSITHYHPQWFLWLTPFVLIRLVQDDFEYWLVAVIFLLCWIYIVLTFDPSLNYGLFRVLNPSLADAKIGLSDIVTKYTDANMVRSLVRSAFAGTAVFYVWIIARARAQKTH